MTVTKFRSATITKSATDGSGRFTALLAVYGPPRDHQHEIFDKVAFTESILDWLERGARPGIFFNHDASHPNSRIGEIVAMHEDEGLLIEGQLFLKNDLALQVYESLLTSSLDSVSVGYEYVEYYDDHDARHIGARSSWS
jgi:HK97 family phage prohead protease